MSIFQYILEHLYLISVPTYISIVIWMFIYIMWVVGSDFYDKADSNYRNTNNNESTSILFDFTIPVPIGLFSLGTCYIFGFNNVFNIIWNGVLSLFYVVIIILYLSMYSHKINHYFKRKRGKI